MRYPVWAVNSTLMSAFVGISGFLYMSYEGMPRVKRVVPAVVAQKPKQNIVPEGTLAIIYQNDLFDTYVFAKPEQVQPHYMIPQPPATPKPIQPKEVEKQQLAFVAPLEVALKGIIYVHDNPLESVVMLQDTESDSTENYQIGDLLQDAQIIKIFPRSVVLIRSNGQQETLYLREDDAVESFNAQSTVASEKIIQDIGNHTYKIYVPGFVETVPTLGQLITVLDATTVYKQGKSAGIKIGDIDKEGLAHQLGLQPDDIIVQVAGMPVLTIDQRMAVYNKVLEEGHNSSIPVQVLRGGSTISLTYQVTDVPFDHIVASEEDEKNIESSLGRHKLHTKQREILEKKYKMAPTVQDIRAKEREKMRKSKQKSKQVKK